MIIFDPRVYKAVARPLLFTLPPEAAQRAADSILRRRSLWRALSPFLKLEDDRLQVNVGALKLPNPIGLAAGYDKSCEFLPSMAALGFGYVVGGTVTESPKPGNPRPRVLRYPKDQALVNSLGFPNRGLEFAVERLRDAVGRFNGAAVAVSVSGVTVDEMVRCHRRLEPMVDAIEINISSPNTAGLRVFQEPWPLAELIGRINDRRRKPLFVKLPRHSSTDVDHAETREKVLALARTCVEGGVEALTAANTRPVEDGRLAVGRGGLSGRPVLADTLRMVADLRDEVGDKAAINACGGIFSGEDAIAALRAGASTVQLLTGLIYEGPGIVRRINREILRSIGSEGVESLFPPARPRDESGDTPRPPPRAD